MKNPLFATKPLNLLLNEAQESSEHSLKRTLGPYQLVGLGVGAIIGAGIFTLTGIAAATKAGPSLTISFVLAAVACGFAGLCYSEFSTMIPIAGSAYTYSYATLGELLAWIIGWDLVLEYAVGAATVSIGWSATLVALLHRFHVDLPPALVASPWQEVRLSDGTVIHGVTNLPAVFVIVLISLLLVKGTQESSTVNAVIVFLKVGVIVVFIAIGWHFIQPANLTPFIPHNTGKFGEFGWSGILSGAGKIFFAYIGFDAVSTAAQEARNPKKDMPKGIFGSLAICTVLFILYCYVLTGIVHYTDLNVAAPLSLALERIPYGWLSVAMNLAVIAGLTSVILVMMLGQSRVFFSMSNDGLLPKVFSSVHPKFRTPWRCNLILMLFVGIFSAFAPISVVGDMTNIGTLFAFVLVCGGIIVMRRTNPDAPRSFRTPLVPLVPILGIIANLGLMYGLGVPNWIRLFAWMAVGLLIYFSYSRHHSRIRALH